MFLFQVLMYIDIMNNYERVCDFQTVFELLIAQSRSEVCYKGGYIHEQFSRSLTLF